jgi:hypothetical protein
MMEEGVEGLEVVKKAAKMKDAAISFDYNI